MNMHFIAYVFFQIIYVVIGLIAMFWLYQIRNALVYPKIDNVEVVETIKQ